MDIMKYVEALLSVIASSIVLIIAGIVYFIVTLFTVKVGSAVIFDETKVVIDPNYLVLVSSILVAASMLSSALGHRS